MAVLPRVAHRDGLDVLPRDEGPVLEGDERPLVGAGALREHQNPGERGGRVAALLDGLSGERGVGGLRSVLRRDFDGVRVGVLLSPLAVVVSLPHGKASLFLTGRRLSSSPEGVSLRLGKA